MEKLKEDLQIRNTQIAQLQKQVRALLAMIFNRRSCNRVFCQITELEQDGSSSESSRFDNFKTLTEAKIALEHLFESSVEKAMLEAHLKSEFEELRQLYNEAVRNTNTLEREIAQMKHDHETQLTREKRENEERVLTLLNSAGSSSTSAAGVAPRVAEEIRKYSRLNEELVRMGEENEKLRQQVSLA